MGICECHFLSKEVLFQAGPVCEESSRMGFRKLALRGEADLEMYFGAISKQR